MVFSDESFKRGVKSGWAYTARVSGESIAEGSGAVEITTSIILTKVKAVTEALRCLQSKQYRREIIVTDSMSTLENSGKEYLYEDWGPIISLRKLE